MPVIERPRPHEHQLMALRAMMKPQDLAEEFTKAFTERAVIVEQDLTHFLTKANDTMTARTLTREGQVKELSELSTNQLQELNKTHAGVRTKLSEQIDTARVDALKRPTSSEDPTVRYLRHKDALDYFNTLDPLQHRQVLDDAVREKDLDFLDALATAPRYRRKFDAALVTAAREQLAEEANPMIAKLAALRTAYDRVYHTAATVVKDTVERAGVRLPMASV